MGSKSDRQSLRSKPNPESAGASRSIRKPTFTASAPVSDRLPIIFLVAASSFLRSSSSAFLASKRAMASGVKSSSAKSPALERSKASPQLGHSALSPPSSSALISCRAFALVRIVHAPPPIVGRLAPQLAVLIPPGDAAPDRQGIEEAARNVDCAAGR
jgi:hypothetical protein